MSITTNAFFIFLTFCVLVGQFIFKSKGIENKRQEEYCSLFNFFSNSFYLISNHYRLLFLKINPITFNKNNPCYKNRNNKTKNLFYLFYN